MPVWLISLITGLTFLTAFKCPRCQEINKPSLEIGNVISAIRYTPVPEESLFVMKIRKAHDYYRTIYNDIVRCSGLSDSTEYEALQFYVADVAIINLKGTPSSAYYEPDSHSIVFAISSVWDKKTVGHELLHMLLQSAKLQDPRDSTEDQHPSYWFNDSRKCKGLVYPH